MFNTYSINRLYIVFSYKRKLIYGRKFGEHTKKLKTTKFLYLEVKVLAFWFKVTHYIYI